MSETCQISYRIFIVDIDLDEGYFAGPPSGTACLDTAPRFSLVAILAQALEHSEKTKEAINSAR